MDNGSLESVTAGWGTKHSIRTEATAITPPSATNGVAKLKAYASTLPTGMPTTCPAANPLRTAPLITPRR